MAFRLLMLAYRADAVAVSDLECLLKRRRDVIGLGKLPSWLISAWGLLVLVLAAPAYPAQPLPVSFAGRVVAVADGDTLTVLDLTKRQHRIRIAGIDAPERRQAFGQAAKGHLSRLVFGKTVRIEVRKTDQYGRRIGRVMLDGWDVGLEQIRAGFAWHFKRFQNEQEPFERVAYAEAQTTARIAQKGLWRDRRPVAPWDFRRVDQQKASAAVSR